VTADAFRRLALSLPEATEGSHMGHADFRVRGKVFATLGYPDATKAVVRINSAQQDMLSRAEPEAFTPVPGGWGSRGATIITLRKAKKAATLDAPRMAWKNNAPKSLLAEARRAKPSGRTPEDRS
jgi:hypothetical protein